MAIDFKDIFSDLEAMGFFDIILPFLLVFTITFAIINKTNIFGGKRNIDSIVALVLAFLAVRSEFFVGMMKSFLPNIAMFMIIILMFLMMLGIFAGENKEWKGILWLIGAIVSFVFILFALLFDYTAERVQFPYWLSDLYYGIDEGTKSIIIFFAILVIVLFFLTKEKSDKSLGERIISSLGRRD